VVVIANELLASSGALSSVASDTLGAPEAVSNLRFDTANSEIAHPCGCTLGVAWKGSQWQPYVRS